MKNTANFAPHRFILIIRVNRWYPPRNILARCKKRISGIPWSFCAYKGTLMISTDRSGPYLPPGSTNSYNRVIKNLNYIFTTTTNVLNGF